jgi:hypothetical protein
MTGVDACKCPTEGEDAYEGHGIVYLTLLAPRDRFDLS